MELNYTLNENDYLQHQLYIASKSERINKERKKSLTTVTFTFLALSFIFYTTDNQFLMYSFILLGILCLLFYPFYLRKHYFEHYQIYISDIYKNRFNEPCKLVFTENSIESIDITGETKINIFILEEINETGKYFYLKTKTGGDIIIPKIQLENKIQ